MERCKQIGRSKYVLYYGVLAWGLLLSVLFSLIEVFAIHQVSLPFFFVRLAVFATLGFFIGTARWQSMERRYGGGPS